LKRKQRILTTMKKWSALNPSNKIFCEYSKDEMCKKNRRNLLIIEYDKVIQHNNNDIFMSNNA